MTAYNRLEDVLTLTALNVSLTLADIYRKIVSDTPASPSGLDTPDPAQAF